MKDFDELAEGLSDLPEWNIMEDTGLERQIERQINRRITKISFARSSQWRLRRRCCF